MTSATEPKEDVLDEVTQLWVKSYQGEVLGEIYFARMAELAAEPGRRARLEMLTKLERRTKEYLVPYLERHGISTDPDQTVVDAVRAMDQFDWEPMLKGLLPVTDEYLGYYRRLGELVGPEDSAAADVLVAHEQALNLFARMELDGDEAHSLDAIEALPHLA